MARIRSVKPTLRTSRTVAQWPFEVRYFFVLLWGYLDDAGRGLDIPKTIAGDCYPLDDKVTPSVVHKWLGLMATTKVEPDRDPPVCRYEVAGRGYVHCVYWPEHQKPNRPSPSMHPPCPVHESFSESVSDPPLSPQVLEKGSLKVGGEGAADESLSEPAPPSKCSKHRDDPDPPACRGCKTARERFEAWDAARRARVAAAPRCRQHPTQLAANCSSCASDRKAGR